MPVTAMDEYDSLMVWQHDVWPPRKGLPMQLVAFASKLSEDPSHRNLRRRISAAYPAHVPPALLRSQDVHRCETEADCASEVIARITSAI
jgi:hypothetical protein